MRARYWVKTDGRFFTNYPEHVSTENLHRIDGPAFMLMDRNEWWIDGKRHRIDGPAVVWCFDHGENEWWVNGNQIPTEEMSMWLIENNIDLITREGQMAFKLRWL